MSLDRLDAAGDEDTSRDVSSVSSSLSSLRANDIDALRESLGAVLDGSDHVHDGDTSGVELVDGGTGRDSDGADEESCLLGDDDVDELVELSSSVCARAGLAWEGGGGGKERTVLVGLASTGTNHREEEVDSERGVLVVEVLLDLVNLLLEELGRVADSSQDSDPSSVGDGSGESGARLPGLAIRPRVGEERARTRGRRRRSFLRGRRGA